MAEAIECLPPHPGEGRRGCHDPSLLVVKATSQSALLCMEAALGVLQDIREGHLQGPVVVHQVTAPPEHQGSASHHFETESESESESQPKKPIRVRV